MVEWLFNYISSFNVVVVSCYSKNNLEMPRSFFLELHGKVKWAEDGGPIGKDKFKKHLGQRIFGEGVVKNPVPIQYWQFHPVFFVFRVWGFWFKLPKSITSLNLQKMAGVWEDSLSFFWEGSLQNHTKSWESKGTPHPEISFYLKGLAMVALKGAPLDSHDPSVFESYQIIPYKFIRTQHLVNHRD